MWEADTRLHPVQLHMHVFLIDLTALGVQVTESSIICHRQGPYLPHELGDAETICFPN